MNDRVKKIRKTLGLTLEQFGERVGVSRSAMGNIENGARGVTEQMVKSICREFNVDEEWLRNGTGGDEVHFIKQETFSLDAYVKSMGATELEIEIVKAYFEMDQGIRKSMLEHFKKKLIKYFSESNSSSSSSRDNIIRRAAHELPGATQEQIEADNAIMEGDDF